MLERLELDAGTHKRLIEYCRQVGIQFLSSPFDAESADLLAEMDIPLFKIPSGEITNLPFLDHVARKGRPIILSTGMSTLGEIEEAIGSPESSGKQTDHSVALCNGISGALCRGQPSSDADSESGLRSARRILGPYAGNRDSHCRGGFGR